MNLAADAEAGATQAGPPGPLAGGSSCSGRLVPAVLVVPVVPAVLVVPVVPAVLVVPMVPAAHVVPVAPAASWLKSIGITSLRGCAIDSDARTTTWISHQPQADFARHVHRPRVIWALMRWI